jgi:predicted dehydrogenase
MSKFRWGILATGSIAAELAEALKMSNEAEILAVASRTQESADTFGKRWDIPRRYASYADLAQDPDVDVVYIATPHNLHYENMLLCLEAGKHVLCEKPLTLNARQAAECIALARGKGLFLMEAMWMRFFPSIAQVQDWIQAGEIGTVRMVSADFCVDIPYHPEGRLYNPELGGGALLDLGIYPLSLATLLLGFPQQIDGHAVLGATGVDELVSFSMQYEDGALAHLSCSSRVHKPVEAFVTGTDGYIKIHEYFFNPDRLTLHKKDQQAQEVHLPYRGNGYIYEVEEVHACLKAGRSESTVMPLDDTYKQMQLMDTLRAQWGVRYPGE